MVDDTPRRESVAAPAASQLVAAPAVVPSVVSLIKRQRSIDHQLAAATEPPAAAQATISSAEVASEAPEADEGGGAVCVVVLELPLRGGEDPAAHYARCGEGAWRLRRPVRGGEARISLREHSSARSSDLGRDAARPRLLLLPPLAPPRDAHYSLVHSLGRAMPTIA